ncbi:MAG: FecR domain-containing protein [Candidatus Gracilibacteria bacterium]|nr:FecR domain-containing protein [Candidatus Gracilibacteria bacterium]MDQ7023637.1 FecR domain-containing protein [Candidatus Gracilibacteria bacterium]
MKKFLKEKLKNKFILIIIFIIISILFYQGYKAAELANKDTNTYIVLIKGETIINNSSLNKEERIKLKIKDIIITKKDSACVIEWGDGSLTRLGENSKVEIQELNVEKDLSKINLQFKLINGKTWSNVVSFLGENSYFKQNFQDIEAAVRGTIFDVNLEKDYVYVANHEVSVQKGEEKKIISQNQAFSISTFSFIEIQKFISEIQDKTWKKINSDFDKEFLNNLKNNIFKQINLDNIDEILEENTTYNELLSQYQKLNFVGADDSELFEIKNKIKKSLISKASDENKKNLIKYSIFDLKDAINTENLNLDSIKDLEKIIGKNTENLENILGEKYNDFQNILGKFNIDETINKAEKIRDDVLNNLFKK